MSALISIISLPLLAGCIVIFVQSGCRLEFGAEGGWLACNKAIGNERIESLHHQVLELDRTSAVLETKMHNDFKDVRDSIRKLEGNNKNDQGSSDAISRVRAHVDEQLRSSDHNIQELFQIVKSLREQIEDIDRVFPFKSPFDENGLLYWIGTQGGVEKYVNPHTAGFVVANRSTNAFGKIADFVGHEYVNSHTADAPGSWMSVDLGAHRSVSPSHYCLRTRKAHDATHSIRNWVFEGATQVRPNEWTEIVPHTKDASLTAKNTESCWKLNNNLNNVYFQHLRIRQTGPNSDNKDFLINSGFEVYGKVKIRKLNKF